MNLHSLLTQHCHSLPGQLPARAGVRAELAQHKAAQSATRATSAGRHSNRASRCSAAWGSRAGASQSRDGDGSDGNDGKEGTQRFSRLRQAAKWGEKTGSQLNRWRGAQRPGPTAERTSDVPPPAPKPRPSVPASTSGQADRGSTGGSLPSSEATAAAARSGDGFFGSSSSSSSSSSSTSPADVRKSDGAGPGGSSAGSGGNGWRQQSPQAFSSIQPTPSKLQPQGDVLLELRNVTKGFGNKDILRDASMQIRRGQAIGIIGGSGTGKSTTLRLMAGLLAPDKGEVVVQGIPRRGLASDDTDAGKGLQIGMVFQSGALFDSLTVGQNVGFLLYEHSDLPHARIRELVARSLGQVGLSGVEDLMPAELSGGMKKRVALARAIIRDDENDDSEQIIMYDEPTAGLDPVASTVVEDLIRSLHVKDGGAASGKLGGVSSYIVVTHQHSTIRRAVDSLVFLHEGSVVWTGSVDEFETTDIPIVAQFRTGSLKGPISYE